MNVLESEIRKSENALANLKQVCEDPSVYSANRERLISERVYYVRQQARHINSEFATATATETKANKPKQSKAKQSKWNIKIHEPNTKSFSLFPAVEQKGTKRKADDGTRAEKKKLSCFSYSERIEG